MSKSPTHTGARGGRGRRGTLPISRVARSLVGAVLVLAVLGGCISTAGISAGPEPSASTSASPETSARPLPTETGPGGVTVERDIVYREIDGQQILLDVCRVPGGDSPQAAVLLVHGGAFSGGDKDTPQWQELCALLAEAGYVAVNLNYRLAPEHRFPAAIEDLQAAVGWIRDNSETYGVDPTRVGVLGGSAGANLAQLLGTSGQGPTSQGSRVGSVVSLSGAADLTERALELGQPEPAQIRRVLDYLGCAELAGCPAGPAASPITQVDASDPPFLLAQSDNESLPVQQTEVMAAALTGVGASPEVLIRAGRAHATRLLEDQSVTEAVLAFLARTLG